MLLPALKGFDTMVIIYLVVLITVFGMGLQSAFGKLFATETYGSTTMITGNVTQAAIELVASFGIEGMRVRHRGLALRSTLQVGFRAK